MCGWLLHTVCMAGLAALDHIEPERVSYRITGQGLSTAHFQAPTGVAGAGTL